MAATDDVPSITPEAPEERFDVIRARMAARANLGVDPTTSALVDAEPGSLHGDLSGATALESEENADRADLVLRAIIPSTSYGEYLDAWAESLGLERKDASYAGGTLRFTGDQDTPIPAGAQVTPTASATGEDPPAFQVVQGGIIPAGGTLDLLVIAMAQGQQGNAAAQTVTVPATSIPGLVSVTNLQAMTGGADVEGDPALSERVLLELSGGQGSGTQTDYRRWALAHPGVGSAQVIPVGHGPGTVDVVLLDANRDPASAPTILDVQQDLDPAAGPGQGLGRAPIGHVVYVYAPDLFTVTVAFVVAFQPGYSLDGTNGTVARRAELVAAALGYVNGLGVGDDIVRSKLSAAIADVRGVADVPSTTINDETTGNIAVPSNQVPTLAASDVAPATS